MPKFISEDDIEKAAVDILEKELKYRRLDCPANLPLEDLNDGSGRESKFEIV